MFWGQFFLVLGIGVLAVWANTRGKPLHCVLLNDVTQKIRELSVRAGWGVGIDIA